MEKAKRESADGGNLAGPLRHLDGFFRAMSHDVRTPLHTIVLHAECLGDGLYGEMSDEQREAIQKLSDAGKYLTGLVDSILLLPTVMRGELTVLCSEVDLVEASEGCVQSIMDKAKSKGMSVDLDCAAEAALVKGDRGMIDQVLIAVLSFVIKCSDKGSAKVVLTKGGHTAKVTFTDSTIHLSDDEVAAICGPVDQLASVSKFRYDGRELCLTLAKEIVRAHDGQFCLTCDDVLGVTCSIELPLV